MASTGQQGDGRTAGEASPTSPTADRAAASPATRRILALAVALVLAKVIVVTVRLADGGRLGAGTLWAVPAFLHQDVWLLAVAGALDAGLSRLGRGAVRPPVQALLWAVYASIIAWTAFNVAAARVLSTPLTWPMIGATGTALSDSIRTYLTAGTLLPAAAVVVVGALAPLLIRRRPRRALALGLVSAAALLAALGPFAITRVESLGLHRNAVATIALSGLARTPWFRPRPTGPLAPLPEEGPALDLTHLRGAARGRNVIWVTLESTGARYLAPYGAALDATPHLTALARRGIVFESVYAGYPESIKGLYSYICSAFPAPHTSAEQYAQSERPCESVASRLAQHGYRTGLFHSGRFVYLGMQEVINDRGFHELHDAASIGGRYAASFGTDDLSTAQRVLSFVDALQPGQRFFAMYMPIAGHHPYNSPGEGPRPFPAKTEQDHYLNDLYAGDAALGALIDGIAQRGLADDTVWVIVGDHGEAFWQHEGNFAHSLFIYDENVHVPLVVVLPGLPGGLRAPQVGSLVDVGPTLLDLMGLEPPPSDGRSLLEPDPGVARFFTDHSLLLLGLRQGPWKLIHEQETGRSRLFDLRVDPGEQRDQAGSHPERVDLYRQHLESWAAGLRARMGR